MEDTLGEYMETIKLQRVGVLILVLMEDTLGGGQELRTSRIRVWS